MSSIYATSKTWMKKITRLAPLFLGASVINIVGICLSTTQKASAITALDWVGWWNCNNDGHPTAQVYFWLDYYGSVVGGSFAGQRGLIPRSYNSAIDPPTSRRDHLLFLRNQGNQVPWFLAMHTWNWNYASGITQWNGSAYGLTCTRQ